MNALHASPIPHLTHRLAGHRGLTWLCVLILAASLVSGVAHPVSVAGQAGTAAATPATASPSLPDITAEAAFTLDIDAGAELYASNPDQRLAPASTTKIATALVAIRHAALDDRVVIDPTDAVDPNVYSHMGLVPGDTVTVEQLLYGLLLPSGNDAARALARHVGASLSGSDPTTAFIEAMNDLAADLGLQNTHFVNPAGEDAPDHYSSARDLALLAAELLRDPTLAQIVQTPSYQAISVGPEQRPYNLVNTNQLLGQPGVIGVKTGTTERAGGTLVTAFQVGDRNRVVTVVLGSDTILDPSGVLTSPARYADTEAILDALRRDYVWLTPTEPGTVPGLAEELAAWRARLEPGPAVPVSTASRDQLRYQLILGPEGPPGTRIGRVLFLAGSDPITEYPVFQADAS